MAKTKARLSAAQEDRVRRVAEHLTDWVAERDEDIGARIGAELARAYPDFHLSDFGFRNLTDFLDRAAPGLSIVGRRGLDDVWSASSFAELDLEAEDLLIEVDDGSGAPEEPWARVDEHQVRLSRLEIHGFESLREVRVPGLFGGGNLGLADEVPAGGAAGAAG